MDPANSSSPDSNQEKKRAKKKNKTHRFAKDFFKGWNRFEYLLLVLGLVLPMALGLAFDSGPLEIIAGTLMIVMTLLLAKGKFAGYFVALAAAGLYAWISWQYKLFGEVIIQICIYLPISVLGILSWAKNRRCSRIDGVVVVVGHVHYTELAILIAVQAAMGVGYYYLFRMFGTEQVIASVVSVCLSVCGGYLLARRSRKAMWFNTASDVAGTVLWTLVLVQGNPAAVPLVVMEILVLCSNFYGIFEWRGLKEKQMRQARRKKPEPQDN